jgi:hypothetical protein
LRESDLVHKITDFLRKVLTDAKAPPPQPTETKIEAVDLVTPTPKSTEYGIAIPSTSSAKSQAPVETLKRPASSNDDDDDDDGDAAADDFESVDEDVRAFGKRNFGEIASPYLTPYLYNRSFSIKSTASEMMAKRS